MKKGGVSLPKRRLEHIQSIGSPRIVGTVGPIRPFRPGTSGFAGATRFAGTAWLTRAAWQARTAAALHHSPHFVKRSCHVLDLPFHGGNALFEVRHAIAPGEARSARRRWWSGWNRRRGPFAIPEAWRSARPFAIARTAWDIGPIAIARTVAFARPRRTVGPAIASAESAFEFFETAARLFELSTGAFEFFAHFGAFGIFSSVAFGFAVAVAALLGRFAPWFVLLRFIGEAGAERYKRKSDAQQSPEGQPRQTARGVAAHDHSHSPSQV